MDSSTVEFLLQLLLGAAVLAPLLSFWVILLVGPYLGKHGIGAGYLATFAIGSSFVLSAGALGIWVSQHWPQDAHHAEADVSMHGEAEGDASARSVESDGSGRMHGETVHESGERTVYAGDWYTLGTFGKLKLSIGYYIDALTISMFCMVSLIASCIHFYAQGYMRDELHDVTDHEVTMTNGSHLHRPGRYHRFFQSMSLFCFSMLGLVVAGNVAMTFVFWELVGICSYFLIGFYVERKSASTAANKAFIVNRIGDFGMIVGMMILWTSLGTLDYDALFGLVRPGGDGFVVPEGMVVAAAGEDVGRVIGEHAGQPAESVQAAVSARVAQLRAADGGHRLGYGLLVLAGLGIFCGCVGKSAQFPLHVWLPDAMEGPTPVSALVHSATMVAAGVFLVARFYPVFVPEALFVIALVGTITLLLAATIAITATDIKRVLAYSTVSQLGYMMLALGVGGWLAGVLHLFTHAFFKSLLFLCSGSVIHAVHTNQMPLMGGLRRKMPWTAYTMLIGCLAIAGAGVPFLIGFSGYYSKDSILEQSLLFQTYNRSWGSFFFLAAAAGASMTAFYMFRLWFLTFAGKPRDEHRYEHAHESPPVMFVPLVVLAVFAIGAAWTWVDGLLGAALAGLIYIVYRLSNPVLTQEVAVVRKLLALLTGVFLIGAVVILPGETLSLPNLLEQARPLGIGGDQLGAYTRLVWKDEALSHLDAYKRPATFIAFGTALTGFMLALAFYGLRKLDPADVRRQFAAIYRLLINKWWFDELYDVVFVRPTLAIGRLMAWIDQRWIDGLIHFLAWFTRWFANFWDYFADRSLVDGTVNGFARSTYALALSLRRLQTGRLRQYVTFIVLGTVIAFLLLSVIWNASITS